MDPVLITAEVFDEGSSSLEKEVFGSICYTFECVRISLPFLLSFWVKVCQGGKAVMELILPWKWEASHRNEWLSEQQCRKKLVGGDSID
jgi:hypothetical protein